MKQVAPGRCVKQCKQCILVWEAGPRLCGIPHLDAGAALWAEVKPTPEQVCEEGPNVVNSPPGGSFFSWKTCHRGLCLAVWLVGRTFRGGSSQINLGRWKSTLLVSAGPPV